MTTIGRTYWTIPLPPKDDAANEQLEEQTVSIFKLGATTLMATILIARSAFAGSLPILTERTILNLNVNSTEVSAHVDYPGIGGRPDCVRLVTGEGAASRFLNQERLAGLLVVNDGPGVIFPDDIREVNLLSADESWGERGQLVYQFIDRQKYVTGIRFETLDGRTLKEVIEASKLSSEVVIPAVVGIIRSEDCI